MTNDFNELQPVGYTTRIIIASMLTLSERVIFAREAVGMKQAELARALGVSRNAISKIETGKTLELTSTTAAKMERVTGFSSEWLVFGRGKQKRKRSSADTDVDKIYDELMKLPAAHRAKIEAEIDFLLSLNEDQGSDDK